MKNKYHLSLKNYLFGGNFILLKFKMQNLVYQWFLGGLSSIALIAATSFFLMGLKKAIAKKIQRKAGSRLPIISLLKTSIFLHFHYFCTSDVKKLWQSKKMFSRK
ncbi:hypothetical protein [Chryseobacterium sp.]|uniref:hypothetical protein n=1 Tax=Chryseobacterium sp. TaxID=1871047 RepID=UPI0026290070|nr:hypothetical protein [Chryseobacterium sp.]